MKEPTIISATELNRHSGDILRRVALHGEHFLIDRDGYPLAVILAVGEYNDYARAHGAGIRSKSDEVGSSKPREMQ